MAEPLSPDAVEWLKMNPNTRNNALELLPRLLATIAARDARIEALQAALLEARDEIACLDDEVFYQHGQPQPYAYSKLPERIDALFPGRAEGGGDG